MRDHRTTITALAGALAMTACAAAWAGAPVCCASGDNGKPGAATTSTRALTDMGKISPSVQNYSQLPDYQVFLFTRDTVRYVEIADASGTPLAAFTAVGEALLTLPIGSDVVKQVPFAPALGDVVYENGSMVVGRRRESDGTTSWQVYLK